MKTHRFPKVLVLGAAALAALVSAHPRASGEEGRRVAGAEADAYREFPEKTRKLLILKDHLICLGWYQSDAAWVLDPTRVEEVQALLVSLKRIAADEELRETLGRAGDVSQVVRIAERRLERARELLKRYDDLVREGKEIRVLLRRDGRLELETEADAGVVRVADTKPSR